MVWTLRIYDEDGTELAYVKKPDKETWDYTIVNEHPTWDRFETSLRRFSSVAVNIRDPNLEDDDSIRVWYGPNTTTLEPEPHLKAVKEQFSRDGIGKIEIADE